MDNRHNSKYQAYQAERQQNLMNNGSSIFNDSRAFTYQNSMTKSSTYPNSSSSNSQAIQNSNPKRGGDLSQNYDSKGGNSSGQKEKITDIVGNQIRYRILDCRKDYSFVKGNVQKLYFYEVKQSNSLGRLFDLNHSFVLIVLDTGKQFKVDITETPEEEGDPESVDIAIREFDQFLLSRRELIEARQYSPQSKYFSLNDVKKASNSFIDVKGDIYILQSNNCYHFSNYLLSKLALNYDDYALKKLQHLISFKDQNIQMGAELGKKVFGNNPIGQLFGSFLGGLIKQPESYEPPASTSNNSNYSSYNTSSQDYGSYYNSSGYRYGRANNNYY